MTPTRKRAISDFLWFCLGGVGWLAVLITLAGCSDWWLTGVPPEEPTEPLWGEVTIQTVDTIADTITIVVPNPNR